MTNNSQAKIIIGVLTTAVIGLVIFMYSFPSFKEVFDANYPTFDKKVLPMWNAIFNSIVSICLVTAIYFIKNKNVKMHRRFIFIACICSTLFLLNYVFYHMISTSTSYGDSGFMKMIYLFILLTHIVLAALSFPFILFTLYIGWTNQVEKHKKIAKLVFPVWLYVAVTGVIVYLMISPYYV